MEYVYVRGHVRAVLCNGVVSAAAVLCKLGWMRTRTRHITTSARKPASLDLEE
jgi:hypothetical protein